jgi:hypothetical protein
VRSALTQAVRSVVSQTISIHAGFLRKLSGQLLFLGSYS